MGQVPLHPALVHVPLGLAVLLPLIALGITLALWRGWLQPRSFAVLVLLQALLVGTGFAALQTGESEEDRVEAVVSERHLEAHEKAAHRFLVGAGIALALGVPGLFLMRRQRALRWIAASTTASTIVVAGLALPTGKAGGELVYVHGAAQPYVAAGVRGGSLADAPRAGRRDQRDDD